MSRVYITFQNGHVIEGESFGAEGDVIGEAYFTTSVAGYIEELTLPTNYGKIAVFTFPQIGNYGWIPEDAESGKIQVAGVIVRDWCSEPSNFRSDGKLDEYLKKHGDRKSTRLNSSH